MSIRPPSPAAAAAVGAASTASQPTTCGGTPAEPLPTTATAPLSPSGKKIYPRGQNPGLRYAEPYYYPYKTYAKGRWLGRELLEVVSTEFRDRSVEYYRHALEAGVTTLNGQVATPTTIVRSGDALQNTVHRHEPPISIHPIQIIHEDPTGQYIVIDKPGGMPVHPTGRFTKHTVTETLMSPAFGYKKVHTVNRLDRLTSGLMFIALNPKTASDIQEEFKSGTIRKEYLARVRGCFPEEEVTVDQPLLTVDRQSGLVVVAPEAGKEAKTIFQRIFYDAARDQSVVRCKPITGRTHQIRVHLQYLGHPIPNDPIYGEEEVWSACATQAKGGIDLTPEDDATPTPDYRPDDELEVASNRATIERRLADKADERNAPGGEKGPVRKLMPRETGEDVGSSSPIKLSREAREVIRRLRRMKDEQEDWARWKDVVLYTSEAAKSPAIIQSLSASFVSDPTLPNNKFSDRDFRKSPNSRRSSASSSKSAKALAKQQVESDQTTLAAPEAQEAKPAQDGEKPIEGKVAPPFTPPEGFCPICYIPLAPDPDPDRLFIYLHARRYKTALGEFETGLPIWGREDWDGSNSWSDRAIGQGAGREVLGGVPSLEPMALETPASSLQEGV